VKSLYLIAVFGTIVSASLLQAIAIVESNEVDSAISPDGWDKGRMQIREQFRDLRIPLIGYEYDPHDPYDSTRLAALILQDHYNRFGCWRLAVSAYNRGAGWVTENGVCSEYCLKVWIAERGLNDKSTRSK